jgi:hypothetical protein
MSCHQVAQQFGALALLLTILAPEVERQLVAGDQVKRQPVLAADLPPAAGQQLAVARLHLRPQLAQQLDRLLDIRADEPLRARRPDRQLDQLAVEQPQLRRGVERSGGHEDRQGGALAGPRFATQEHVALRQRHGDGAAELVDADRDRLPQRQRLGVPVRPRHRDHAGQRVTPDQLHRPGRGVVRVPGDADLARLQTHREFLGALLDVLQ